MSTTRRHFLATSAAAASAVTLLPFAAMAEAHAANTFATNAGDVTVHPIEHASIVLTTPVGTIFVDPVGDAALYADHGTPDLILITHEHGDHYNADTLAALVGENTQIIANPAVYAMLSEDMKAKASEMANGATADYNGMGIDAVPAYNTTADRAQFHPQGRDNGYVLTFDGLRVYISGDTEDTPEMRALENIDVAFLCMNLPFTMDKEAAASAVADFMPSYVYPYHYRGQDGGTQNPEEFAALVGEDVEVIIANWYGDDVMPT
ncbi:MBL fold metallo-hydrolase [Loktanella sp. DJP18]|uniref:MBL fold metallo-hydrolase n=1 Tax=Loktanella sp. DJP18 TaxID=3409788 RepID=UPI003BB5075C